MNVKELREEICTTEQELKRKKEALEKICSNCCHQWEEPVYDPVIRPGYMAEGDPPGTMGVDRRLPCYVERSETPYWNRTCFNCGSLQRTSILTKVRMPGRIEGTTYDMEVPDFTGCRIIT